ncbi:MAG: LamG-like jellyroll fold domain-containing protein [Planctomycetota bacterium]
MSVGPRHSMIHAARPVRHDIAPGRGVTLLEMIVVIGLITLLLGMGVGSYIAMSKSYKEEGAASQIDVILRQVRNSAIGSQSPAWVEINTETRRITPWASRTVALWHFEDCDDFNHTTGSRHNAVLRGAKHDRNGKIGKCARLAPGNYVDGGNDPDFDLEDGGYIEAYIRPLSGDFTGDNFIFSKDGAFSLKIGKKGVLIGEISGDGKRPLTKVFSKTYRIAPGRWTKVAFAWDRNVTRVMADDLVLATGPGATPPVNSNSFIVGSESSSFEGLVDEVRVQAAIAGNKLEVNPTVTITHNTAPWNAIYFGSDGALDMRFHGGPVRITLESEGRIRGVAVDMFGTPTRLELKKKGEVDESESTPEPEPKPKAKAVKP